MSTKKRSLDHLTKGEVQMLQRRRRGLSITKDAAVRGLTVSQVRDMEANEGQSKRPPKLTDVEYCVVLRRRTRLTQQQVADALGVSRYWVMLMENEKAPIERLVEYWEKNIGVAA